MSLVNLDLTQSNSENAIVDEHYEDVGSETFALIHDAFFGSTSFSVRTASGGGGTLLTQGVDYELSDTASDLTLRAGENIYTRIKITNASYQTGNLYVSYHACADLVDAKDFLTGNDFLPIGTIIAHGSTTAPEGWLICDGTAVKRAQYGDLFTVIGATWGSGDGSTTFNLPDLRGAFLRGTGSHGSETIADGNPFTGPSVGVFEDDQVQGHIHSPLKFRRPGGGLSYDTVTVNVVAAASASDLGSSYTGSPADDGTNGTPRTGDETRPFAAGVTYIIKASQIQTSGLPAEALKYDTGWVSAADLTDATITITHGLDASLHELIVKVFIKRDAGSIGPIEVGNTTAESGVLAASSQWGLQIEEASSNALTLQTGSNGIIVFDSTGSIVGIPDGEYRVVVYKPESLLNYTFANRQVIETGTTDITRTLPDADMENGPIFIKKSDSGSGKITIAALTGQEGDADGAELTGQYAYIEVVPSGGKWWIKDYLDSGSDTNGWYVKYADGTMEQWNRLSSLSATTSSANAFGSTAGTMYYDDTAVTFPVPFTATSVITVNTSNVRIAEAISNTTTGFSLRLWHSTSSTTGEAQWHAVGRWKT